MIETIKEFISQYLPAITSVGGTIVAIATFFANIKKILAKKDEETSTLKSQLIDLQQLFSDATVKNTYNTENIQEELNSVLNNNSLLTEENQTLKEELAKLDEIVTTNKQLKNQLIEALRRTEE